MEPIRVDVWSDIACPWCWVGKRHLEQAIEAVGRPVEVTWHAFELDPSAPRRSDSSVRYVERLATKYGVPEAEAQGMIDRMTETGARVGLDFRFDRVRPTNTFDAHRLLAWAKPQGSQGRLKERLLEAYMSEGADLGDPAVLAEEAAKVELDPVAARAVLDGADFEQEVRMDEATAHRLGVRGVPFFVFAGRYGVSGAQPPQVLADALREAAPAPESIAEACGPDGCAIPPR